MNILYTTPAPKVCPSKLAKDIPVGQLFLGRVAGYTNGKLFRIYGGGCARVLVCVNDPGSHWIEPTFHIINYLPVNATLTVEGTEPQ